MRWKASAGAGVQAAAPNAARAPTSVTAAPLLLSAEISTAPCGLCASSCWDTHGCDLACLWGLSRRCGTCWLLHEGAEVHAAALMSCAIRARMLVLLCCKVRTQKQHLADVGTRAPMQRGEHMCLQNPKFYRRTLPASAKFKSLEPAGQWQDRDWRPRKIAGQH